MSRERKEKERMAKKLAYRAERGSRVLQISSSSDDTDAYVRRLLRQLDAMPGKPEEKYIVLLRCSDSDIYSYPIYGCSEGFTAALQDAIAKHKDARRADIRSGCVQGIGDTLYQPPDYLVRGIANGAKVLVTRRLENSQAAAGDLRGSFGQGSR